MVSNILVIGASGGANVARQLADSLPASHRLILIERLNFAYHPISSLRGAVIPGFEENNFASLDNFFDKGSRHVVLSGTEVTKLDEDSVTISREFEGSSSIPFVYACLALGATYPIPGRPRSTSREEGLENQRQMQKDIKAAKSILVVGGGPVGVEFVGEVRTQYPKSTGKAVTLATSGGELIPGGWKKSLGQKIHTLLTSEGIDIKYNAKVDLPEDVEVGKLLPTVRSFELPDGGKVEADFVIMATGGKPNTTLVKDDYPEALNDMGQIKVEPTTLRLLDPKLGKYFAIGDCTDSPGPNTYFTVMQQAPVVSAHLLALAQGKGKASKLYKEPMNVMVVPFGPSQGHGQIGPFVMGSWVTSLGKGKTLFVPDFKKLYRV